MDRTFAVAGAILALSGVALGAFGAHVLEPRIGAAGVRTFETGVRYHLVHALALLWLSWAVTRWGGLAPGGWLLLSGVVLFSGSLYLLAAGAGRGVALVTPLGGLCLLAGWAWIAWRLLRP